VSINVAALEATLTDYCELSDDEDEHYYQGDDSDDYDHEDSVTRGTHKTGVHRLPRMTNAPRSYCVMSS
jgi:hypothetical protein